MGYKEFKAELDSRKAAEKAAETDAPVATDATPSEARQRIDAKLAEIKESLTQK